MANYDVKGIRWRLWVTYLFRGITQWKYANTSLSDVLGVFIAINIFMNKN